MNRTHCKNWIAVASAEHARVGRDHPGMGFMQVNHGKLTPLKRIASGDRVAYYAPATEMRGADKLQSFVSIGRVQDGEPYQAEMGEHFVAWRRDVAYVPACEAPIAPLLERFHFIKDLKHWGYSFRFGLFEIDEHDLRVIAQAMRAAPSALDL